MIGRTRIGLAIGAALLFALALAVVVTRFSVNGDVTAFVPEDDADERLAISKMLARSGLGKGMIILVDGPSDTVAAATSRLADALTVEPQFEWVQTGLPKGSETGLRDIYFSRRLAFLSDSAAELETKLSDEALAAAAAELKAVLTGPLGPAVRSTVGSDPLLAYSALLQRANRARPASIEVEAGAFVTAGENKRGVIFLATNASPFDGAAQRKVLAVLESSAATLGAGFAIVASGVNVLAVDGERSTRTDVKRISVVSLLGTGLLFFVCFRRLRYFGALVLPIGFGIVGGLAATLVAFGGVHGITLAFGATLIGVSVDYVLHFLAHHVLGEERASHQTLANVWPAIALGGATTIAGFVGLGLASTPGMRQIAVFGAVGIAFALLATYTLLPLAVSASGQPLRQLEAARRGLGGFFSLLSSHRRIVAGVAMALALLSVITLPRLEWNDNPRSLATINDELVARDERVRAAVTTADSGRMVVARGSDWQSALAANDHAAALLEDAVAAGELDNFRSLHSLLWSAELQQSNIDRLWNDASVADRLRTAFSESGFRPEAFDSFASHLAGPAPAPVMPSELLRGPLAPLFRGFYVEAADGSVLIMTQLFGVHDAAALSSRFDALGSLTYFDQDEFLRDSYGGFRTRVLQVVSLSLIAVFLLVFARYRRLRPSLAAFIPAVLAAAASLAVLGLLGVTLNLLHVLGLMLVLSIGVDYGVFVVEASRRSDEVGVAILGTAVSCATTLLGFGLLAMSENPALRALGSVTALGCILSLIIAPAALALSGKRS